METMIKGLALFSPEETRTKDSIAVLWNKIEGVKEYRIYANGELLGRTESTDYTIEDLLEDKEYLIRVEGQEEDGIEVVLDEIVAYTSRGPRQFNVMYFGAAGDGITDDTHAIQKAIDTCIDGGEVYIPEGVYLTGALYLKRNISLYLEKDAKLIGSTKLSDYPIMKYRFEGRETECYASLINTKAGAQNKNIKILGEGIIDANGSILRQKELKEGKGKPGRAICLRGVEGAYIKGITVRQSPAWCVHVVYCNNVSINQVKIYTKYSEDGTPYEDIVNGDGIDIDSSSNVNVFHSMAETEDDCVAIKSGRDMDLPSENIRITNCRFESGFGVTIGSEMSGGIRNVLVQDCICNDVYSAVSIKAPRGRGGIVENVCYDGITQTYQMEEHKDCRWFRGAIYIDQFYGHDHSAIDKKEEVTETTPVIKDIVLKNITVDTVAGNAIYIAGLPEQEIEHVTLENIRAAGRYGMDINNVKDLNLQHVDIQTYE